MGLHKICLIVVQRCEGDGEILLGAGNIVHGFRLLFLSDVWALDLVVGHGLVTTLLCQAFLYFLLVPPLLCTLLLTVLLRSGQSSPLAIGEVFSTLWELRGPIDTGYMGIHGGFTGIHRNIIYSFVFF